MEYIFMVFLLAMAILDGKTKKISLIATGGMAVIIVINILLTRDYCLASRGCGVLIGVLIIASSFASRGGIGMGDGIIFTITGLLMGGEMNLVILMLSLVMAAVYSGYLLMVRRKSRKYDYPFVPFIFASYCGVIIYGII